jgi:hypothetical protein
MKSERLGHSSSSRRGLSGSNDDSSVVSLKELVANAGPASSVARATTLEDSGLIDLKKLMANAPPSSDALPPVLAPSEAGLFDLQEMTLAPHVAAVSDASNEAPTKASVGWAKWFGAAIVGTLVVVGTLGILHARTAHVPEQQIRVAAAMPATPIATNRFVEEPRPAETPPVVTTAAPTETKAPAIATTTQRSPKTAVQTPSRTRTQQETPPPKVEPAPPPPAACDLMCEIQRAARKPH